MIFNKKLNINLRIKKGYISKLVVFLMEEISTNTGLGFEAIGWYVALIDNYKDSPEKWNINYVKGSDTFEVIVGSCAVLQDENYVYTFGVKEPSTHETYLLRFEKDALINGELSKIEWWTNNQWTRNVTKEPKKSALFKGQTEFSVHYDQKLEQFIQIQAYGFEQSAIGYRLADQLYGPWSKLKLLYTPAIQDTNEFVYSANAHPEYKSDGLIVTYNINHIDFEKLFNNEDIYFPKVIEENWGEER
jgi:hypothetical protein